MTKTKTLWDKWVKEFANGSRKWLMACALLVLSLGLLAAETPLYGDVTVTEAQSVLERHCQSCHLRGVANAPRIEDETSWHRRLADRNLETIIDHAYQGYGRMPARGFCRTCSRDEIAAAVILMLPEDVRRQAGGQPTQ
ncbi:MAG: c-type cytochrome [Natronospirillum sp.]